MKNFFFLLYIFLGSFIFAQTRTAPPATAGSQTMKAGAFINVNTPAYPQTNFSIQQLITNVLINGGSSCTSNVSNVTVSPNLAASNPNRSWGYFNKGTSGFPFNEGIVLMTGYAAKAGNTFISGTLSDALGTAGDTDLAAAIGISNSRLSDATYIEFDFVPVTSQISFNYIFASEEYSGDFACSYTDGFALLIKKVGDPGYTNLAILPGGAGPVSTTNIHGPLSCGSANSQYYAGNNTSVTETNFNGRTVPLTAVATVIPGQTYHFKMVLADASIGSGGGDTQFDTGVFLQAGSFNIGVQLNDGSGVQLPPNVSICAGTSQVLSANVATPGATYQWYLNGSAIAGATNPTYTVTTSGTYSVQVLVPGSTCPGTAQIVVTVIPNPVANNTSLTVCSSAATASFNLTTAQPNINTVSGTAFTYYVNQADAIAGNTNSIANPASFTSGNATIYVLVQNGNCKSVSELQLIISVIPPAPNIISNSNTLCPGGSVTLTSSSPTGNVWSNGATTPSINVITAGVYTLTVTTGGCTSPPATATITAQPDANVQITGTLIFCSGSSSVLTATSVGSGNTYLWSTGATTPSITVTTSGTYIVTVTTPAGCTFSKEVLVQVDPAIIAQNTSLTNCASSASTTFDLVTAQPSITTTAGVSFTYYTNQADALANNGNNIANPSAFPSTGNTIIYVLVKKGTCSQIVQIALTVTQTIVPTISASSTVICGSGSITLTSNFATGNNWSTGETTQTITVATAGTFTLTQTGSSCTSTPASITIIKNEDPGVLITGNLAFCAGSSTQLTATASGTGNTYLWSTGATTPSITVTTPGTYTVTVTTAGGCPFPSSATVTQNPVPTTTNSSLSLCSLNTTAEFNLVAAQPSISTSSGITFSYYTSLADANAGAPNFITNPDAYPSPTTIIYVRVSNGNCFKVAQLQLTVTVTPVPVITQSAQAICAGTPVVLTSNYSTGNVWSTGATTQSITVSTAGIYSLIVTNGNCPSQSVFVDIQSNANPNVQITGVLSFCQGSTTTLTATSTGTGNTYSWSTGAATPAITVNTAGTYTVTVTTPAGCQFTKAVTVTQEPTITITIAPTGQINCITPTITLNATTSIFPAGSTILWTAGPGGTIVSGANTLSPTVSTGGNYTLTITNTTGLLCSQQSTITVVQNTVIPVIAVTAPKTKICAGEALLLTFSGAQTYTVNGVTITGNTFSVTPNATTIYTVSGVGANGCQGNTATFTVTVVPAIVSTLADLQFCKGLTGILDAGAGPNYTYLWDTGETTQTITVDMPGVHNVTINNGTCTKTFSATVSYTPVPVIEEVVYEKNTLIIYVKQPIVPNLEYSINGGINWQSTNIFTNVLPNLNYTILVRVKDEFCYGTIQYYTFFVKNVITPNADGINDEIDFSGVSNYKDFKAIIFDRYGKEVFRATPGKAIWNGNYIKLNMPTASYWYEVNWVDPISNKLIQRTGWILLKNRN